MSRVPLDGQRRRICTRVERARLLEFWEGPVAPVCLLQEPRCTPKEEHAGFGGVERACTHARGVRGDADLSHVLILSCVADPTSSSPQRQCRRYGIRRSGTHCCIPPLRVRNVGVDSSRRGPRVPTSSNAVYHLLRTAPCIPRDSRDNRTRQTARGLSAFAAVHHVSRSVMVASSAAVKPRRTGR